VRRNASLSARNPNRGATSVGISSDTNKVFLSQLEQVSQEALTGIDIVEQASVNVALMLRLCSEREDGRGAPLNPAVHSIRLISVNGGWGTTEIFTGVITADGGTRTCGFATTVNVPVPEKDVRTDLAPKTTNLRRC
jgi:hypothetical protein